MAKGPVIRHTNTNDKVRFIKKVTTLFSEEMQKTAHKMIVDRVIKKKDIPSVQGYDVTGEELLQARKKLVNAVKRGMLEKKDMELEIAVYSAIVWFLRQEKTRRDRILAEW